MWSAASGDALLAVLDDPGRDRGLYGLGAPDEVAALLAGLAGDSAALSGVRYASVDRGAAERVRPGTWERLGLAPEGSAWDWMWTTTVPAPPEVDVERLPLDARTVAEVRECLDRAHPRASTSPDDPRLVGWWGTREEGRLVAVVGAVALAPGLAPHLVSLGVDPRLRGRGLGRAVTAAAVRDGLQVTPRWSEPLVSLGLYADNAPARRVYESLGFRLGHRFASRRRTAVD